MKVQAKGNNFLWKFNSLYDKGEQQGRGENRGNLYRRLEMEEKNKGESACNLIANGSPGRRSARVADSLLNRSRRGAQEGRQEGWRACEEGAGLGKEDRAP